MSLEGVKHHSSIEEIVEVLCNKTQNTDREFFKAEVAFFLAKLASCMRASVKTKDRGILPLNIYAIALGSSGYGKGYSVAIMEDEFLKGFKDRFLEETLPVLSEQNLWKISSVRAARNATDQQEEFDKLQKEYNGTGAYVFTFDSATAPAVKQFRHKLLLANAGSLNFQQDEFASNLLSSLETLNLFLELYDKGVVKQKLIKNTKENVRNEEIDGKTPTNMLLFGTPSKLFDGGQTEDMFYSMLETGYARRCIFGYGSRDKKAYHSQTAEEIYHRQVQASNDTTIGKWASIFYDLASPIMFNWMSIVPDDVGIRLMEYKIQCERIADELPDHAEIRKAEISHRYFKAIKLAGVFAFIDASPEVQMHQLMSAILLVEESGKSFERILDREKTYVKLAKYIAEVGTEVTHSDLHEALPFYKTGNAARNEMISLATAWGYKKHIIIKKNFVDGIEFFKGETLKETNLAECYISYSDHYAYQYANEKVPFEDLHNLTQSSGFHWINHHVKGGHRLEENVQQGFNLVVIDVDGGVTVERVKDLLKEYKYMLYTTKSHCDEEHRFRIVFPTNYIVKLDSNDYKEFMNNILAWLPFVSDETANQRSKKWESFNGNFLYNDGQLLDVLAFIPKTSKNENYKNQLAKIQDLSNLERWFAQRIATGNRNNQMLKYAFALVDDGMSLGEVENAVKSFNSKLNNALTVSELEGTILVSVAKRYI